MIRRKDRPHMFVKELEIYIDYLKNKIDEISDPADEKNRKSLYGFAMNLNSGIEYYKGMFSTEGVYRDSKSSIFKELDKCHQSINQLIENLELSPVPSL